MKSNFPDQWRPPIHLTEALDNRGIEELAAEILRHKEFLIASGGLEKRRKERARLELAEAVESSLKDYLDSGIDRRRLEALVNDLVNRKTDPQSAALEIIDQRVNPGPGA